MDTPVKRESASGFVVRVKARGVAPQKIDRLYGDEVQDAVHVEIRRELTGNLIELAGFLLSPGRLSVQPRVLDGQGRLDGEDGHEIDDVGGKRPRCLAADHESADDPVLTDQRHG